MTKKIVIVLSMGRTGSSALTRSLTILGVDLGNHLLGAAPINPTGLWEDAEILRINTQILHLLDTEIGRLSLITRKKIEDKVPDSIRDDAIGVLTRKMENSNLFGFKDVRTYLLLDFWKPIFKELSLDTTYVLAVRNPISVANSYKKFGEDIHFEEKTYLLWFQHVIKIVLDTEGEKRLVIDYDRLIDDPISQVYRIAAALGINQSDISQSAISQYADEFLDKSLRNNIFSTEDISKIPFAPGLILKIHETLQQISSDQIEINDLKTKAFFQQCKTKFDLISPAIRSVHELHSNFNKTHQQLERLILQQISSSIKIAW